MLEAMAMAATLWMMLLLVVMWLASRWHSLVMSQFIANEDLVDNLLDDNEKYILVTMQMLGMASGGVWSTRGRWHSR